MYLSSLAHFARRFLLTGLVMASTAMAYDPPLGIPAPSFGIDETAPAAPSQWPAAQAPGYYYVDNTHPNATDTANTYGYPDKPRLTVPGGPHPAGTYVELHGGPYAGQAVQLTFNCSLASPCWFRGLDSSTMPLVTGSFGIVDSQYLIVENINFNGGIPAALGVRGNDTHHIGIRNSIIANKPFNGNSAGIGIIPGLGGTVHDIVVHNMTFHTLGDWTSVIDQDFHGVNPNLWNRDSSTTLYNIWILDSTCYNISGNCVQVNAGNWPNSYRYLHHVYMGRNVAHDNRQAGFWSKQGSDIIISENISYNNQRHGAQPGDGIGYQYGPDNLWIIYNHIYNSNYGIRQSDTNASAANNSSYIVGNLIHDIHPEVPANYNPSDTWRPGTAISLWHGSMNRYIVDNTIYDAHNGITAIYSGPVHISGNTISEIDAQGTFLGNL